MADIIEQGTEEWLMQRVGKVTASRLADLMAKTKSGYSASRKNYMAELVCERLVGIPAEHFVSKEMQWGTDNEPIARGEYEIKYSTFVDQVGFIDHPEIPMTGGSPDGLVEADGMVEIKCPNTATHLEFLLTGTIDGRYYKQMQWNMECSQRQWCDFVSYDPRLPGHLNIKIVRVQKDNAFLVEARKEVKGFLSELDEMIKKLEAL